MTRTPRPSSAIVATAGTTNAGIVDDLEGLGSYAREHDLWFHIDGAYGGAAIFSESHRHLMSGIRHADSFIVDPHKWLFAPLDCCALLYRNPTVARKVLAQQASYLDVLHDSSRRELRVEPLGLRHSPLAARAGTALLVLARHQRHRRLPVGGPDRDRPRAARRAAHRSSDDLEMVRPSSLSIVLFRKKGWDAERYNEWSQSLLSRQIAFVTPTKWEGETVARMAFLHPNTTDEMVIEILDSMRD